MTKFITSIYERISTGTVLGVVFLLVIMIGGSRLAQEMEVWVGPSEEDIALYCNRLLASHYKGAVSVKPGESFLLPDDILMMNYNLATDDHTSLNKVTYCTVVRELVLMNEDLADLKLRAGK